MSRNVPKIVSVAIAASAAVSGAFDLFGYCIAGVLVPSAWTAADISFEVDVDGSSTYVKVIGNDGALIKITGVATAVSEFMVPPEIADGIVAVRARVVSTNTASEANINQDAARTVKVVLRPL